MACSTGVLQRLVQDLRHFEILTLKDYLMAFAVSTTLDMLDSLLWRR
jgi:hypothetical protein